MIGLLMPSPDERKQRGKPFRMFGFSDASYPASCASVIAQPQAAAVDAASMSILAE